MSKECTIYTVFDPGPAIVELTAQLIEPLEAVDAVRFVAWQDDMGSNIGAFIPEKKEVIIDLGNVLNNADFYRLGMLHVPAVFFTTLWALFHEITHAKQIASNPELAKLDELPEDYERAAQQAAKDLTLKWAQENTIPPLTEWGWLGEQVAGLINDQYSKGDLTLLDELEILQLGGIADAHSVTAVYEFKRPDLLFAEIAEGNFGLRHRGKYYLKAEDFFGLDRTQEVKARASQTVSMG